MRLCAASKTPLYLCIDGLVGAGKSTLAAALAQALPELEVLYEPCEQWFDVQGQGNLWGLYQADPKRWSYTTETYISLIRAKAIGEALQAAQRNNKKVVLVDRSMFADRYGFSEILHRNKLMTELEWVAYKLFFDYVYGQAPKPDGLIYIRISPELALARVRARGREVEATLPLSFQQEFYACNEDFFIYKKALPATIAAIPVLVIDGEQNFKDDIKILQTVVEQVVSFLVRVGQERD